MKYVRRGLALPFIIAGEILVHIGTLCFEAADAILGDDKWTP